MCTFSSSTVVAGGTHQYDDWSTAIRPEDTKQVLEANFKYLPALKVLNFILLLFTFQCLHSLIFVDLNLISPTVSAKVSDAILQRIA